MAIATPMPPAADPVLAGSDLAAWQRAIAAGRQLRHVEAQEIIADLLQRNPDHNMLLLSALRIAHNAHDSEQAFRAAVILADRARSGAAQHEAWAKMLFWAPFVSHLTTAQIAMIARQWTEHLAAAAAPLPPPPPRPGGRLLRIGYLSPAFGFPADYHPLAQHDPEAVETFAYSSAAARIAPGTVVPKFGRFRDLFGLSDAEAAAAIRADDIDILVDLGGTGDAQRNGILACRPARIQAGWSNKLVPQFGPPIDWVIGDAALFASGDFAVPGAARLLALPQALCVVAERSAQPPSGPLPALERGRIIIGSTASIYKISDATLALWSRVLHRLPEAVLAYSSPYLSDLVERKIRQGFAAHGIGPHRFRLETRAHQDFGQAMNGVDLALDSVPFSSNFSCLQALRQGVPVVSLAGDRLAGRFGASLLGTIGHPELVAASTDGYVETATALAGDLDRLQAYRQRLPQAVARARLNDFRFTASCLEQAYARLWAEWQERQGPDA